MPLPLCNFLHINRCTHGWYWICLHALHESLSDTTCTVQSDYLFHVYHLHSMVSYDELPQSPLRFLFHNRPHRTDATKHICHESSSMLCRIFSCWIYYGHTSRNSGSSASHAIHNIFCPSVPDSQDKNRDALVFLAYVPPLFLHRKSPADFSTRLSVIFFWQYHINTFACAMLGHCVPTLIFLRNFKIL